VCQFEDGSKYYDYPIGYYMTVGKQSQVKELQASVNKLMTQIGNAASYKEMRNMRGNNYLSKSEYQLLMFGEWLKSLTFKGKICIKNYSGDLRSLCELLNNLEIDSVVIADVDIKDVNGFKFVAMSKVVPDCDNMLKINCKTPSYEAIFLDKVKGAEDFVSKLDKDWCYLVNHAQMVEDRKYLVTHEELSKVWLMSNGLGVSMSDALREMNRRMTLRLYYPSYYELDLKVPVIKGLSFSKVIARAEVAVAIVVDEFKAEIDSHSQPVFEEIKQVAFKSAKQIQKVQPVGTKEVSLDFSDGEEKQITNSSKVSKSEKSEVREHLRNPVLVESPEEIDQPLLEDDEFDFNSKGD